MTLFVDGESNDGSTVFFDQGHNSAKPRLGSIAIFKVHGVHDRAATDELKTCFDDSRFSGVDDKRQSRGLRKPGDNVLDICDTVTTDIVDTHIEQVGAIAHLLFSNFHTVIEATLQHGVAKCPGPIGVGPLTDC